MAAWPWLSAAGALVGLLFGLFGVGGSSFATPLLSLLGVPGLMAVASALPATIPAALAGAYGYRRDGDIDWATARRSVLGGFPATIAGALLSNVVGGPALLVASGVVLGVVGVRVLRPLSEAQQRAGAARRERPGTVVAGAAGVGLFTGLLANGGGFLLVPLFVVVLGLGIRKAAGTSLVVISALAVPTLVTHWALGHIDWMVAAAFAAGAIPAALVGSRLAQRLGGDALRLAFGWLLVGFALYFVARLLVRS
ncbi:MAG: sulfite exporter TauE/SafE family protein [Acidimicrobiales bacterium]